MGVAPSPYDSGAVSRDGGSSKAGSKLARTTVVDLAWFCYQPASALANWWHERFGKKGSPSALT
jgi:transposase